jgi:polyisoprenyl-phosphate glycosyltransferase
MPKHVCIIIPVFNEEGNIHTIASAIHDTFNKLAYTYEILFVDDGSADETLSIIEQLSISGNCVKFLSFSKNNGHQAALKAGLDYAEADCAISMDGDMQHPPSLISDMLAQWEAGYEVVYTIRKKQKELSFIKRKTSNLFYKLLSTLSDIELENGCADFRLLDRKVVCQLKQLKENDIFLRGLVKWIGFKQKAIEYEPLQRLSGQTKYSYRKMLSLAVQGITSFSTKPLYLAAYIGFFFSIASLIYIPYAVYSYWFGHVVSGWVSLIVTVAFFGGLQLMILGIIGLYLGKLFMQSKGRPMYIINKTNLHGRQ